MAIKKVRYFVTDFSARSLYERIGGDGRARTYDLMYVKHAL